MKNKLKNYYLFFALIAFSGVAQEDKDLIGKWDLEVEMNGKTAPSWLEVKRSGVSTLIGYFVEYNGSARPISEVHFHKGIVDFSIPPQWNGFNDLHFTALLSEGSLKGTLLGSDGKAYAFKGERAPKLIRNKKAVWGKPKTLFSGKNLKGWRSSDPDRTNQWIAVEGILQNPSSGVNLITEDTYEDFKLHIEFRYPKGSNSGVYLRGRYEVQIEDNYGKEPTSTLFGGIYGFLTPNEMAALPAGEWQSYDITLEGRRVSVVANGKKIITDQIIPGITGGALDSKEGLPGPLMLQGDHGPVEYRNISIQLPE